MSGVASRVPGGDDDDPITRAADAIAALCNDNPIALFYPMLRTATNVHVAVAEALAEAGLLRTEADESLVPALNRATAEIDRLRVLSDSDRAILRLADEWERELNAPAGPYEKFRRANDALEQAVAARRAVQEAQE